MANRVSDREVNEEIQRYYARRTKQKDEITRRKRAEKQARKDRVRGIPVEAQAAIDKLLGRAK